MKLRFLWFWLFLGMGLPVGAAWSQTEIPGHPRQLQFEDHQPSLPTAEGRRHELDSGPVVYIVEDHTWPLVEIGLATRAGSYLDPPESAGLASLTATQLRRGGSGSLGPDEFDNSVDDLGAHMDAKASGSRAGATLSIPTWLLPDGLDLFFDMISAPRFDSSRLDNARRSLLEGLTRRNEDPLAILEREWGWLLYGRDHFTTRPLTPKTLESIHREEVVTFHRRYWHPEDMIIAVSGDVAPEEIQKSLDDRFSRWDETDPAEQPWPPPSPSAGVDPGLFHYEFDSPQAKIILGHRFETLFDWHDRDRFVLAVVAEILGGRGAVSRVGGRLRTSEGLVYRVLLNLDPGDFWPGEFQIFFETKP
ncbi:MAG: pitrilysin family protein [Acidobacteriota bacterium]